MQEDQKTEPKFLHFYLHTPTVWSYSQKSNTLFLLSSQKPNGMAWESFMWGEWYKSEPTQ